VEEVYKFEEQGVISFRHRKPKVDSPMTVTMKENTDRLVKRCLCRDGSRFINLLLKILRYTVLHWNRQQEILHFQLHAIRAKCHSLCHQQTH